MQTIHARTALLPDGWAQDVSVTLDKGRIAQVDTNAAQAPDVDILLPAPTNLHSHGFQHAMAGLTEGRGDVPEDSFWTWRALMYRFLDRLTPEHVQAITAQAQMEMLEAGFAAVAEFHYLHHQPAGVPYDNVAEMAQRICAAAEETGIGLTLLPVLYMQGGVDGRALQAGQDRFGNDLDRFLRVLDAAEGAVSALPEDAGLGVAPHSLRAVTRDALMHLQDLRCPVHMHLAEQAAEVEEIEAAYGARPVTWALDHLDLGPQWCLIHCTQMTATETRRLAQTGAVAGLCPITESSLGDGIFNAADFVSAGGKFGLGTDSNILISLREEIRTLEYSQRLAIRRRAVLADADRSTGRAIFDAACVGGARAAGRGSGAIAAGQTADLMALSSAAADLIGRRGDAILDTWIFAGAPAPVTDVWAAGRHMVQDGRHVARTAIDAAYRATLRQLAETM